MILPPLHAFSHGYTCGHQHIPGLQFVESQCAGHGTTSCKWHLNRLQLRLNLTILSIGPMQT